MRSVFAALLLLSAAPVSAAVPEGGASAAKSSPKVEAGANAAKTSAASTSPKVEAGTSAVKSSPPAKVEAGTSSATKPASVPARSKPAASANSASKASGAAPASTSTAPAPTVAPPTSTGPESPPGAPRFAWPSMRVLEQIDANEVVEAGGVPVVLRAVVVKERAEDLVQRFADAFRAGGLHVPPGNEQPQLASGAAMLTAVDMYRGITFTVILQPQEGGITLVYLGEANHALRREPGAVGDIATLPPGARQVLRVNEESSRTLSFLVPMSAGEVDAFYAQALGRDGWRREEGDTTVYTRSGEELRLMHEPAEGGLRSVVLVHRGRARAPESRVAP